MPATARPLLITAESFEAIRQAALDTHPISGLTHCFYRYPARFSPAFAAAAIEQFSKAGGLVLDPYMGGATTIVEALARGRRAVGCDVNSLAVFVARAKTTLLTAPDRRALEDWADRVVQSLQYSDMPGDLDTVMSIERTRNLTIPTARPIKKLMALALLTLRTLPSEEAQNFARCALLNAGQWALNGRKRPATLSEFRSRLSITVAEMLEGLEAFERRTDDRRVLPAILINDSAAKVHRYEPLMTEKADVVVSSPPYPGIHVLYHRWQVDGRRETPAPYWLAECQDGEGTAFYNFAARSRLTNETYFAESLRTLRGIRAAVKDGAIFVQMIAFSDPAIQLPRYLQNMSAAGFAEVPMPSGRQVWRSVPSRRWHANFKGKLSGAREALLIHQAV